MITAVPELLDQLALGNSIVTLNAMGCQTAIAEKILARGGDYLLTLKGNHPWLLLGSGVVLGPSRDQAGDEDTEQGFAASASVVHELKEAEV